MKTIKITKKNYDYSFSISDDTIITVDGEVIIFETKKVEFKKGDVLRLIDDENVNTTIIFKDMYDNYSVNYFVAIELYQVKLMYNDYMSFNWNKKRHATESEKQQLFDALAKEGKCWNAETMEIENVRWRPKPLEYYYTFAKSNIEWNCDEFDNYLFKNKLVFKTEKERDEALAKWIELNK